VKPRKVPSFPHLSTLTRHLNVTSVHDSPTLSFTEAAEARRLGDETIREQRAAAAAATVALDCARDDKLSEHGGDRAAAFDALLQELEKWHIKADKLEKEKEGLHIANEQMRQWIKDFRPESLDDLDDVWVNRWTPFTLKGSLQAFFEVFVEPRSRFFESYSSFSNHRYANPTEAPITEPPPPLARQSAPEADPAGPAERPSSPAPMPSPPS
jgi:hypothetical protein